MVEIQGICLNNYQAVREGTGCLTFEKRNQITKIFILKTHC